MVVNHVQVCIVHAATAVVSLVGIPLPSGPDLRESSVPLKRPRPSRPKRREGGRLPFLPRTERHGMQKVKSQYAIKGLAKATKEADIKEGGTVLVCRIS